MVDAEEVGFVICSKCGARIRADREWCLRCHEPLVAWKKQEIPLPSWVQTLGGGTMIFGLVGAVAVGVLAYSTLGSGSSHPDRPLQGTPAPGVRASTTSPTPRAVTQVEQVIFVDSPRRGTAPIADADLASTRTSLEQALQRDPKNVDTLNSLGLTLERLGFIDSAFARLSEAVAVDPRNWIYHFNLAHVMSLRQDWMHAASEYAAVLEIFPENYAAQYNMAVAYHFSGNEPAAIKAFQRAIEMAPGDPAAHLSYGLSLEASDRPDDAMSEYRNYLQMVPTAHDAAAVNARIQALSHQSS